MSRLKPGDRVQHVKHGAGTVEDVCGNAIAIELDSEPGKTRTFMADLGVILREDGSPLAAKAEPAPPEATTAPTPEPQEPAMADDLLTKLTEALRQRGLDAKRTLALECGLLPGSFRNWRHAGRVPPQHVEKVRAWLNKAPCPAAAKPEPARRAKPQKAVGCRIKPQLAKPGTDVDIRALLHALGRSPCAVYVIEGTELVTREAVLL